MTDVPQFVLDANVFIEAAKRYYAFDIAPRFWQALIAEAANGRVRSIDRVKKEIDDGENELKRWANDSFHEWFDSTNAEDVVETYRRTMVWAHQQNQFTDAAKAEFASKPDAWVVAFALARGCIVVTEEKFNPEVKRRIPIPNVCRAFNVQCIDTFELLRTLGVRLG
jgi:hypothetical protein